MKRSTKIIAATVLIAATSSAVFAYGKQGHWNMNEQEKAEFIVERVSKKLDLNEVQSLSFSELTDTVLAIIVEGRDSKEDHLQMVKDLLQEPVLDQAKVLQIVQQKTQMVNDKAPAVVASLAGFLDTLGPEQKNNLQQMLERHHEHRHGHKERK
ncbi:MAG: Spy/CpxP family protein refolding chaperone [Planctomycetota bacterium]|jgi:Spy/CpxP family protein refolding chaperone